MNINWRLVADTLPDEHGVECYLVGETETIVGPIMWVQDLRAWVDLFGSDEAGTIISPTANGLLAWAPAAEFGIPDPPSPEPGTPDPAMSSTGKQE